MKTFRVCGMGDVGSFGEGERAALAYDVLKYTATHQVPDQIDLTQSPHLKPYSIACVYAIGAMAKLHHREVELLLPNDAGFANHLTRLGLHEVFRCQKVPDVEQRATNLPAEIVRWPQGSAATRIMEMLAPQAGLPPGVFPTIAGSLDEMIGNALTHSESPIDCVVVGQSFPTTGKVEIAILDLGITIRTHLARNSRYANQITSDRTAIELATTDGVTGTPDGKFNRRGVPNSGAGLSDLRRFCEAGRGELTILSGETWVTYSEKPPAYGTLRGPRFMGCLVNVRYFVDLDLPEDEPQSIL